MSHWTEGITELNGSVEGLDLFVRERLQEIQDEKVSIAIGEAQSSSSAAGEDVMADALRSVFESMDHIKSYWKLLEIYEMPGPFNPAIFPSDT